MHKTSTQFKQIILTKPNKRIVLDRLVVMIEDNPNLQFHSDCNNYFESLREKGETDFEFEDEYFFTMPAISQMSLD
jgi:hypothetical protein